MDANPADRRRKAPPRPLDKARLEELALAYVARFATSGGKLADYLSRKLRERGWDDAEPADVPALVGRMVEKRYVDDAGYALAKGQGLLRRGYGARRIDQALGAARISEGLREDALGSAQERRAAALVLARKRRFGPFGRDGACHDPVMREKQVAAMLRAGHPLATARRLVNAGTIEDAESWVDEELD
ncbi:RecX family transcriptional regulator [Novosphingobium sp. KCTC 2891]|uniref:regulatory protein RecX n=1 Tax=Novosphingobium sp. KCTC 2891 TaxID=2989730 RepID=UPI00222207B8|nr:RecX family transcriptional regulator [Novosphingobium sp. KCTC 2891]MCW1383850.1 RecX family transcriptional regulator [Novosphingobium sp. KCTC 2891]